MMGNSVAAAEKLSQLHKKLDAGDFVITAEVCPPKGCDCGIFLEKARSLKGIVDAVNVTDNQGGNMRISPLAASALLIREGIEPIFQITCRDRNRMALQSDLLGAAAVGVRNILVLSGDHISFGDHQDAQPVFDLDSVQLLQTVRGLCEGIDLAGNRLQGAPSFYTGAASAPAAEPFPLTMPKLRKKVACGARFFQTQAIFEPDRMRRFSDAVAPLQVKTIAGILLLKSAAMARFVNTRIPGLKVPEHLIDELERAEDPVATGIEIARRTIREVRPYCDGIHIMAMGREDLVPRIAEAAFPRR